MVLCKELAHHMDDLQSFSHELVRVLKPGGVLLLTEPFKPGFRLFSKSSEYDAAKEAGLSHQDYTLSDYLAALKATNLQVREMSLFVFRGRRHPKLVQLYHFAEKIVGADKADGTMWFKRLVSSFFGGSFTIIGVKGENRSQLSTSGKFFREVQIISPERLSTFSQDIEHVKNNIEPFVRLLDEIYYANATE
jgi:SAM-dependent methyltransferase